MASRVNFVVAFANHLIANNEGSEMPHLPRRQFLGLAVCVLATFLPTVHAQEV